jgi:beta-glucanase (GH16 family)
LIRVENGLSLKERLALKTKLACTLGLLAIPGLLIAAAAHAAEPPPGWKLVWADEFDGAEIDRTKWDRDLGNGFYSYDANQWISGWGNAELEYYTREKENSFVEKGELHVRAIKESLHGCGYTSARLKTRNREGSELMAKKYGRFEIRAKLPTGQGIWPAIWMLPQDEKFGPWAASGEIDIVEARGQEPEKILGTLHFGSRWPANAEASREHRFPQGQSIADYHVYALEWEPGEIRWYVDGQVFAKQTSWWSSSRADASGGIRPAAQADLNPWPAPFDQPFYFILNVAVGGKFLGNPDKTTAFPTEMRVDYVRVFDKVAAYAPAGQPSGENLPLK